MNIEVIQATNNGKPLTYGELYRALEVIIAINPPLENKIAKMAIEDEHGHVLFNNIISVEMSNTKAQIVGGQPNDSNSRS